MINIDLQNLIRNLFESTLLEYGYDTLSFNRFKEIIDTLLMEYNNKYSKNVSVSYNQSDINNENNLLTFFADFSEPIVLDKNLFDLTKADMSTNAKYFCVNTVVPFDNTNKVSIDLRNDSNTIFLKSFDKSYKIDNISACVQQDRDYSINDDKYGNEQITYNMYANFEAAKKFFENYNSFLKRTINWYDGSDKAIQKLINTYCNDSTDVGEKGHENIIWDPIKLKTNINYLTRAINKLGKIVYAYTQNEIYNKENTKLSNKQIIFLLKHNEAYLKHNHKFLNSRNIDTQVINNIDDINNRLHEMEAAVEQKMKEAGITDNTLSSDEFDRKDKEWRKDNPWADEKDNNFNPMSAEDLELFTTSKSEKDINRLRNRYTKSAKDNEIYNRYFGK